MHTWHFSKLESLFKLQPQFNECHCNFNTTNSTQKARYVYVAITSRDILLYFKISLCTFKGATLGEGTEILEMSKHIKNSIQNFIFQL